MAKTLFLCVAFAWPCILGSKTFLHLSDIHLDFEYVENGIDSKDKMCHAAAPGQHKGNASSKIYNYDGIVETQITYLTL